MSEVFPLSSPLATGKRGPISKPLRRNTCRGITRHAQHMQRARCAVSLSPQRGRGVEAMLRGRFHRGPRAAPPLTVNPHEPGGQRCPQAGGAGTGGVQISHLRRRDFYGCFTSSLTSAPLALRTPRSPSPRPSPSGEENRSAVVRKKPVRSALSQRLDASLPLPKGEGWGEGEGRIRPDQRSTVQGFKARKSSFGEVEGSPTRHFVFPFAGTWLE